MAEKRFSRRDMLRNIGIVGVGAWAVPVLTSLPAQAATAKKKNPCKGIAGNCDVGFTQCGTCSSDVGDGSYCWDTLNKKGKVPKKTACAEDVFCAEVAVCATQKDCAKGELCITDNGCTGCTADSGVCSPKCKGGSLRLRPRKTRPASRRTATMAA